MPLRDGKGSKVALERVPREHGESIEGARGNTMGQCRGQQVGA